jgi:hypothetical protein
MMCCDADRVLLVLCNMVPGVGRVLEEKITGPS